MEFDIITVGAGPAGSYAAYLLARQGARVALLERARFPRAKTCGGALSRKALDLVDFDLSPVVHARISGAWFTYGPNALYRDIGGCAAAMTVRDELDAYLVAHARAVGAAIHLDTPVDAVTTRDTHVIAHTPRGDFTARYLLAADGVASRVRAHV